MLSAATPRFQAMDPGGLGAMAYDPPAADGSSCRVMAESLRGETEYYLVWVDPVRNSDE